MSEHISVGELVVIVPQNKNLEFAYCWKCNKCNESFKAQWQEYGAHYMPSHVLLGDEVGVVVEQWRCFVKFMSPDKGIYWVHLADVRLLSSVGNSPSCVGEVAGEYCTAK